MGQLPPTCPLWGIEPATWSCALTGTQTGNLSVHETMPNQNRATRARALTDVFIEVSTTQHIHSYNHPPALPLILGTAHPLPFLRPSSIRLPIFSLKSENIHSLHFPTSHSFSHPQCRHFRFHKPPRSFQSGDYPKATDHELHSLMVSTLPIPSQIPSYTPCLSLPPQPTSCSLLTLPG